MIGAEQVPAVQTNGRMRSRGRASAGNCWSDEWNSVPPNMDQSAESLGVGIVEYAYCRFLCTVKAVQSQVRAVLTSRWLCFSIVAALYTAGFPFRRHCHHRICNRPGDYLKHEVPTPTVPILPFDHHASRPYFVRESLHHAILLGTQVLPTQVHRSYPTSIIQVGQLGSTHRSPSESFHRRYVDHSQHF